MAPAQHPLAGQRILITGGNKGIGLATAELLGPHGARIIIGARDPARGEKAASALRAAGYDATAIRIDVTDPDSIAAAAASVERDGGLDVLINNAGIGFISVPPSELSTELLLQVLDTNLFGVMRTTQAMLPSLRRSSAGRIVNVSSVMGSIFRLADPEWKSCAVMLTPYSISKAALNAWTTRLSSELAGTAIKVNAVEPGFTATDLTGGRGEQQPADAARVIVKYAAIGADGPTGGYFDWTGSLPW